MQLWLLLTLAIDVWQCPTAYDLYGLNEIRFTRGFLRACADALSQRFLLPRPVARSSSSVQSNRQHHQRINFTKENKETTEALCICSFYRSRGVN
jgi:hypothetical protein